METNNGYVLPYELVSELTGHSLFITPSIKFQAGQIDMLRYFINLNETERPLIRENIQELAEMLDMPLAARHLLYERLKTVDITFIGVSVEGDKLIYKTYLGFIELHTIETGKTAYSIEWSPGDTDYSVKEYIMEPEISIEDALQKTKEILHGVHPEYLSKTESLYALCLDIVGETDFTTYFLSAIKKNTPKSTVYYNLTEEAPVYFKNLREKINHLSEILNIPQTAIEKLSDTIQPDDILEHMAVGIDGERLPFVTFYKNASYVAPVCEDGEVQIITKEITIPKTNTKSMEQTEKKHPAESEAATVFPAPQESSGSIPEYISAGSKNSQAISPSGCGCGGQAGESQLVFALGDIGFDIPNQEVRNSLTAEIGSVDPESFLRVLGGHFTNNTREKEEGQFPDPNRHENKLYYAQTVIWTFNLDNTPIYAIRPEGPFAQETYATLRNFMVYQLEVDKKYGHSGFRNIVRSTLAGKTQGTVKLSSGLEIPVVVPELRGLYAWTVDQLLDELVGPAPSQSAAAEEKEQYDQEKTGIIDFLERVYFALRNVGITSKDRAINFSATNAFQIAMIFKKAYKEKLALQSVNAVKSPFCRPGADCWDVILTFFNPMKQLEEARTVFRFTVDVSGIVPSLTGPMRSWKE